MTKVANSRNQATVVVMAAALALILLISVVIASQNDVWDTSLDCAMYDEFNADRADDYQCRGSYSIDEKFDTKGFSGEMPEYDIYCRGYALLPSGLDLEDVMDREPLPRPSNAEGGVIQLGLQRNTADDSVFNNPTAIYGRFESSDDEYFVCEARKIVDDKLEWIECRNHNDVGICKESELEWTLYANYNGVSERMEITNGRWIVLKSNEFSKIELSYRGITPEIEPESPHEEDVPVGGLL